MRVFISSPGGLEAERAVIIDEISSFSTAQSQGGGPAITTIRWPEEIGAGRSEYGQSVINQQAAGYDIFVGIIAARMGTPTPRANSGTEEEFDCIIEAILNGQRAEVLLFFSNMPTRLTDIDPNQLSLVKAFKEKAKRLGVLYHMFNDHGQLRTLFRRSFQQAHRNLSRATAGPLSLSHLDRAALEQPSSIVELGCYRFQNKETAPQRSDARLFQIAQYRGQTIVFSGKFRTTSPYFRFGFKYFDCREQLFGPGSIQTLGQNIMVHVGRNSAQREWFVTIYRGGYRVGSDQPIGGSASWNEVEFDFKVASDNNLTLRIFEDTVFRSYFVIDGLPCLALLAWSDEHEFNCEFDGLRLRVNPMGSL